jgi:hypothetical protein
VSDLLDKNLGSDDVCDESSSDDDLGNTESSKAVDPRDTSDDTNNGTNHPESSEWSERREVGK